MSHLTNWDEYFLNLKEKTKNPFLSDTDNISPATLTKHVHAMSALKVFEEYVNQTKSFDSKITPESVMIKIIS